MSKRMLMMVAIFLVCVSFIGCGIKETKELTYLSKVKITDGFYKGAEGIVTEQTKLFGTETLYRIEIYVKKDGTIHQLTIISSLDQLEVIE